MFPIKSRLSVIGRRVNELWGPANICSPLRVNEVWQGSIYRKMIEITAIIGLHQAAEFFTKLARLVLSISWIFSWRKVHTLVRVRNTQRHIFHIPTLQLPYIMLQNSNFVIVKCKRLYQHGFISLYGKQYGFTRAKFSVKNLLLNYFRSGRNGFKH